VVEVNSELEGSPGKVNEEPTGGGWFLKLKVSDTSELDDLMDEEAYKTYLAEIS
jgi:glycine cleavage system H protein